MYLYINILYKVIPLIFWLTIIAKISGIIANKGTAQNRNISVLKITL